MIRFGKTYDPKIWGPPAWTFLHTVTLNYPKCPSNSDKQNYKNFFNNLENILPCDTCRRHFKNHLKKYPLTYDILSSKRELIKWLIDVHNEINKMNGKREYYYDEVLSYYDKLYGNENTVEFDIRYLYIFFIIMVLFVFFLLLAI